MSFSGTIIKWDSNKIRPHGWYSTHKPDKVLEKEMVRWGRPSITVKSQGPDVIATVS